MLVGSFTRALSVIDKDLRSLLFLNRLSLNIDRSFALRSKFFNLARLSKVPSFTSLIIVFPRSISVISGLFANKSLSKIAIGLEASDTFFNFLLFLNISLGISEILLPFKYISSRFTALSNTPAGRLFNEFDDSLITFTFGPKSFSELIS